MNKVSYSNLNVGLNLLGDVLVVYDCFIGVEYGVFGLFIFLI